MLLAVISNNARELAKLLNEVRSPSLHHRTRNNHRPNHHRNGHDNQNNGRPTHHHHQRNVPRNDHYNQNNRHHNHYGNDSNARPNRNNNPNDNLQNQNIRNANEDYVNAKLNLIRSKTSQNRTEINFHLKKMKIALDQYRNNNHNDNNLNQFLRRLRSANELLVAMKNLKHSGILVHLSYMKIKKLLPRRSKMFLAVISNNARELAKLLNEVRSPSFHHRNRNNDRPNHHRNQRNAHRNDHDKHCIGSENFL